MVTRERVYVSACRVPVASAGLGVRVDEENVALAFVQSSGENPGKRYFFGCPFGFPTEITSMAWRFSCGFTHMSVCITTQMRK